MIVTKTPAEPDMGDALVIEGVGLTVKLTPLLSSPSTVSTTLPVVAPVGTRALIWVLFQFVGVAVTPLNVSVLLP